MQRSDVGTRLATALYDIFAARVRIEMTVEGTREERLRRIREERRLTDGRPQLCEEDARIIDEQLHILTESKTPLPVRLTLFVPDGAKQGGALTDVEGVVRRVDAVARELIFADKTVLPIDNILALAILSGS